LAVVPRQEGFDYFAPPITLASLEHDCPIWRSASGFRDDDYHLVNQGKSPLTASDEQRGALARLAGSRDRGEANRARATLLTLSGWSSPRIAEAFGVGEDPVSLWRSDFAGGGVDRVAPGPAPVKSVRRVGGAIVHQHRVHD
jgi:hypothetical protein